MSRRETLLLAAALTLFATLAMPAVAAALPGWSTMPAPVPATTRLNAAATFGDAGLVVAGAQGAVAVSENGGVTWTARPATGAAGVTLRGVAFTDAEHGVVVGDSGTILVGAPDDQGTFTWTAATLPGNLNSSLRAVAMSGTIGYVVGDRGVLLRTDDEGATWTDENPPTKADLNAVAVSADGNVAAAVGAGGTLLVNDNGTWEARDTGTNADLLDVALTAAGAVYCSSTERVYSLTGTGALTALPAPPLSGAKISSLALVENGASSRLVAGGSGGWLAGIATGGDTWTRQTGGGTSEVTSLAAADGGVCYATTAGGRVQRGLNGGWTYTFALTAKPAAPTSSGYKAIVTAGNKVDLRGSTTIPASGVLLLEARATGSSARKTVASGRPGASITLSSQTPAVNTLYRLRFLFAGKTAAVWPAPGREVRVGVRHKVGVSSTSITVRRGTVYQVSGSVFPTKIGGVVEVWTDRAGNRKLGPWHRILVGGYVPLANGSTYATRRFGTPVTETYHLKVRMAGDAHHLVGWSPRVTVTVR
jgi:photosystem II stability/assembly factor-like uncharacterized protein